MKKLAFFVTLLLFMISSHVFSQDKPNPTEPSRLAGYFSVLNPLVKFSGGETSNNFSDGYVIGFPSGFVLMGKSNKAGFIFELVPLIQFSEGSSRMANLVFNPGVQFHYPKGWNFNALLSFETSGRYGFTPVLSKTIKTGEFSSWFVTVPMPVRFGNDSPGSLEFALQLGVAF
jgi:hypothetical protein